MPKFAFVTHKPKAEVVAKAFQKGANALKMECRVTKKPMIRRDEIAVFYGVVPSTFFAFLENRAAGSLIYLDNGWLSHPHNKTFRWAWNGVQADPQSLWPDPDHHQKLGNYLHPWSKRRLPEPDKPTALVCLQTPQYFENVGVPFSRDTWCKALWRHLRSEGYYVAVRPKPSKAVPETHPLETEIDAASLVVSLNSAVTVRALARGVPAVCSLPTSLGNLVPCIPPPPTKLEPPDQGRVLDTFQRLASADFTLDELASGDALHRMLSVPEHDRKGLSYDRFVRT